MNGAGKSVNRHTSDISGPSRFSPLRKCTGECATRRSHTQFKGNSTVCIRCTRRKS